MATKSLKVKKGFIGAFQFTVYLNGMGMNAKEAWEDVMESLASNEISKQPSLSDTKLIDLEPWPD